MTRFADQGLINHLGRFRLAAGLWSNLARAKSARFVSVSSGAHQGTGIDFDDIHFHRPRLRQLNRLPGRLRCLQLSRAIEKAPSHDLSQSDGR